MRSHHLFYLTRGTLLASLLFVTACDPSGLTGPDEASTVHFRFEQTSVTENVLNNTTEKTGTFEASGVVVDRGSYIEVLGIGKSRIYGYRRLVGEHGTVDMQFLGLVSDDGQRGQVQVTIRYGTGDYAGLAGSDSFEIDLATGASAQEVMSTFTAQRVHE